MSILKFYGMASVDIYFIPLRKLLWIMMWNLNKYIKAYQYPHFSRKIIKNILWNLKKNSYQYPFKVLFGCVCDFTIGCVFLCNFCTHSSLSSFYRFMYCFFCRFITNPLTLGDFNFIFSMLNENVLVRLYKSSE